MDLNLIFGGDATIEDLIELHDKKGLEFVVEDGQISEIIF